MTNLRCTDCGVCHYWHESANKSGGVGRLLPWDGDLCPVCIQYRRERRGVAARRVVARALGELDADEYEQRTFGEVLG